MKLHRCRNEWLTITPHPCWRVQKALDDAGVEYELVLGPVRRGKRDALAAIEFEDGSVYREVRRDGRPHPREELYGAPAPRSRTTAVPPAPLYLPVPPVIAATTNGPGPPRPEPRSAPAG